MSKTMILLGAGENNKAINEETNHENMLWGSVGTGKGVGIYDRDGLLLNNKSYTLKPTSKNGSSFNPMK